MMEFELEQLESATDSFSPSHLIGKGSHGSVYRGILKDGRHVAVKKQSSGLRKLKDDTKLENEARILSSLSPNPCIISLLGVSQDSCGNKIVVTEYMPNGTLHEAVHSSTMILPWQKRVDVALQIARAVHFLHGSSPSIVHRDIKSANVVFDERWNVKLADFGLAVRLNSDDELNLPAGTIGYLDPGYTTPGSVSAKIDVFSYGVVLLELISGRKVIDVLRSPASIAEWAVPLIEKGRYVEVCDERVHFPRYMLGTIKQLLNLAVSCLLPIECLRPSMGEIVAQLESLVLVEPTRFPFSMNFIRDIVVDMMRRRRKLKCGAVAMIKTGGACAEHDGGSGHCSSASTMSKGTLLVKEILADITLK